MCALPALRYSFKFDKFMWMPHLKLNQKLVLKNAGVLIEVKEETMTVELWSWLWWIISVLSNFGKKLFFLFLFYISLCKVLSSYEIIVREIHPRFACYLHSLPSTEDTSQQAPWYICKLRCCHLHFQGLDLGRVNL